MELRQIYSFGFVVVLAALVALPVFMSRHAVCFAPKTLPRMFWHPGYGLFSIRR